MANLYANINLLHRREKKFNHVFYLSYFVIFSNITCHDMQITGFAFEEIQAGGTMNQEST